MDGMPPDRWREYVYSTTRHKRADPGSPVAHYARIFEKAEHQMHIDAHLAWHERNRHLLSGITSYHTGLPGAREELIRIARDRRLEREERKARRGV